MAAALMTEMSVDVIEQKRMTALQQQKERIRALLIMQQHMLRGVMKRNERPDDLLYLSQRLECIIEEMDREHGVMTIVGADGDVSFF